MLQGCGNDQERERELNRDSVINDVKGLGYGELRFHAEPFEWVLVCAEATDGEPVSVVSAERIFTPSVRKLWRISAGRLVSRSHSARLEGLGNVKVLTRHGSSYNTWCMTFERWRLIHFFNAFYHASPKGKQELDVGAARFPVVWTKYPEYYENHVYYGALIDGVGSLEAEKFQMLLEEAETWVHPEVLAPNAARKMREGEVPITRARGLIGEILGNGKISFATVKEFAESRHSAEQWAGIWGLGVLGDTQGVAVLMEIEGSDPDNEVTMEIVKSLFQIDGREAISALTKIEGEHRDHIIGGAAEWALETMGERRPTGAEGE